jgi:hypothetical protein
MKIKDVERFTIPISRDFAGALPPKEGTTVEELIKALKTLPKEGVVSTDFNNGDVIVMHYKDDIDPDEPWIKSETWQALIDADIRRRAAYTYIPPIVFGVRP